MPHVNDARRLGECARLLGAPLSAELAARKDGRRPLDTADPGQREFQALLLWCLLSPDRSLSWDTKTGRSLRDMQCYYNWVSPRQDRLVTGWTVAERVASYLLPWAQDGDPGFSGVPGLRLHGVTSLGIELVHLPTGGMLELRDSTREDADGRAGALRFETGDTAGTGQPLWLSPALSAGEETALGEWSLGAHAPALSAVMARIHLLWHGNTGAELGTDPATGIPRLSWWGGPPLARVASLLTDPASPLRVPGSRRWHRSGHAMFVGVGDAAVGLRGPAVASWPAGPAGQPGSGTRRSGCRAPAAR